VTTLDRTGTGCGADSERVFAASGSVTDSEAIKAAFAEGESRFGKVQVLIANAGITRDRPLLRMTEEDFQATLATDLTGVFLCIRRAALSMIPQRQGSIILVGSVVGSMGSAGQANYAAAKAALVGLARSIARELGPRGITANLIAPGFIETNMTADLPKDLTDSYLSRIPAGRFGQVADVAQAAVFLADAHYVNGAVLPVDGGLGMGH
jgi:3-oxoacyl-[acyl-carrier protein] reductase